MQQRISIRSTDCLTDNGKSGTSPEFFSMIQNRKLLGMIAFVIAVGVWGAMAQAQAPQVALLGGGSASGNAGRIEAFRQGLRELGYTEGKNILLEQRWAEGKLDRLAAFAAELVRLKMDTIVSAGPAVTRVLRKITSTVPFVMGFDDDPVGSALSLALLAPEGTSPDYPPFLRSSAQNNWSFSRRFFLKSPAWLSLGALPIRDKSNTERDEIHLNRFWSTDPIH